MDFSDALRAVKDGKRVRRAMWDKPGSPRSWAGSHLVLGVVHTAAGATFSQLLSEYPDGSVHSFAGANWDLLADDWEIA